MRSPAGSETGSARTRLPFPLSALLWLHGICGFLVVVFTAMALLESGPSRVAAGLTALSSAFVWAAAGSATLLPRRRRDPDREGGRTVLAGSRRLVTLLLAAWALMLTGAAAWVVVAVVDLDAVDNPGWLLVLVLGALGSLPDLVRLATGRLHRWRVTLDESGLAYRGWRTSVRVPWADVRGVRLVPRPLSVEVERRDGAPVRIPPVAFDVPPEQIVELVEDHRPSGGRRGPR